MKKLKEKLRKEIAEAKQQEIEINRHLGYPDDYMSGSLIVKVKWRDLEKLLQGE